MKDTSILAVDDEEYIRIALSQELSSEGFKVQTASDGEEAIKILQQDAFDLVILDIKMPKIDGFEVLKFIQNKQERPLNPKMKTIMLSGFPDLKNVIEAKRLGAADFVPKPYDLHDLVTTIKQVLEKKVLVS